MTTAPAASITVASALRSRCSQPPSRPVATMMPSRAATQPFSTMPRSAAAAPVRGRSSFSGASVSSRARRMTRSASLTPAPGSLEEARFDHAAPVEAVELQRSGAHLEGRVERDEPDELSTQDADARRRRTARDLVPDARERGAFEVEDVHRHLYARGTGELEPERLDRGEAPG